MKLFMIKAKICFNIKLDEIDIKYLFNRAIDDITTLMDGDINHQIDRIKQGSIGYLLNDLINANSLKYQLMTLRSACYSYNYNLYCFKKIHQLKINGINKEHMRTVVDKLDLCITDEKMDAIYNDDLSLKLLVDRQRIDTSIIINVLVNINDKVLKLNNEINDIIMKKVNAIIEWCIINSKLGNNENIDENMNKLHDASNKIVDIELELNKVFLQKLLNV